MLCKSQPLEVQVLNSVWKLLQDAQLSWPAICILDKHPDVPVLTHDQCLGMLAQKCGEEAVRFSCAAEKPFRALDAPVGLYYTYCSVIVFQLHLFAPQSAMLQQPAQCTHT